MFNSHNQLDNGWQCTATGVQLSHILFSNEQLFILPDISVKRLVRLLKGLLDC